jgi:site-specific recombinase XerD
VSGASGPAVLRYDGKRGTTWSIRYADADGERVWERLGRSPEWNRRRAKAKLRERLVAVERDGYRKPSPVSFESFARRWADEYPEAEGLRRTTCADYRAMVEKHLIGYFEGRKLAEITTGDVDAYVAAKRKAGLGPRTLGVHLTRLGSIFDAARRAQLVRVNPVSDAKRPRVPKSRWTILSPVEISAVMRAFDDLIAEAATEAERAWRETAKAMTVTMQYAWLRRGELLGLRWGSLELAHPEGPRLTVCETWVRGYRSEPKTDDGERTIGVGAPLAEELWQHRARSHFKGDDELVFPHPFKGTPIPSGYFGEIMKTVLARAGIERPMREYHDWRHTGITNAAGAGMNPLAIKQMAGHADFKTTQAYIDLAGVVFGDEVGRLSDWYGAGGRKRRSEVGVEETESRSVSAIEARRD